MYINENAMRNRLVNSKVIKDWPKGPNLDKFLDKFKED